MKMKMEASMTLKTISTLSKTHRVGTALKTSLRTTKRRNLSTRKSPKKRKKKVKRVMNQRRTINRSLIAIANLTRT